MSEDNKNQQHQDDQEHKEVSSTQAEDEQQNATSNTTNGNVDSKQQKEKVIDPLPIASVKPSSTFKLFSYTGDNSKVKIINWIRMYENMATRADWTEEEMKWNLSSYLDEEAFDYYVEHVLAKKKDWKQAKESMLTRFDQFEIEPYMEFLSCKWSPQIELKDYFKKMRALGVAADIAEEDILSGLTRGVPSHLRSELSFVTSLKQWVAVASCLQQRLDGSHYNKSNNQSWKNSPRRGGNRNHNNNSNQRTGGNNKPRMNQSQTLKSEHQLQNASSSNEQNEVQSR